jgi:hypothetical protein
MASGYRNINRQRVVEELGASRSSAGFRVKSDWRTSMADMEKPAAIRDREDLEEVFRLYAEGKPITDPDLVRRIQERSEAARKAVFERNGLLDIAVPSIRELRDGDEQ